MSPRDVGTFRLARFEGAAALMTKGSSSGDQSDGSLAQSASAYRLEAAVLAPGMGPERAAAESKSSVGRSRAGRSSRRPVVVPVVKSHGIGGGNAPLA